MHQHKVEMHLLTVVFTIVILSLVATDLPQSALCSSVVATSLCFQDIIFRVAEECVYFCTVCHVDGFCASYRSTPVNPKSQIQAQKCGGQTKGA